MSTDETLERMQERTRWLHTFEQARQLRQCESWVIAAGVSVGVLFVLLFAWSPAAFPGALVVALAVRVLLVRRARRLFGQQVEWLGRVYPLEDLVGLPDDARETVSALGRQEVKSADNA